MKKVTVFTLVISMLFAFIAIAGAAQQPPGWPLEDGDTTVPSGDVTTAAPETTTAPQTTAAPEATTVEPCAEHTWGEWGGNGRATCDHDGTKSRVCIVCGAVDIVVEQQLEHTDSDGDERCDYCGKFMGTNILIETFLKFISMLKAFFETLVDLFR